MKKDFDKWNKNKQFVDKYHKNVFCYPREIWWCVVGVNIGAEIDGKNHHFERPVLVMKVYNKETIFVLPLTTKANNHRFYHKIKMANQVSYVSLTQGRVISNKRLLRKLDVLEEKCFNEVRKEWLDSL